MRSIVLTLFLVSLAFVPSAAFGQSNTMTNQSVIDLCNSRYSKGFIVKRIEIQPGTYKVTDDDTALIANACRADAPDIVRAMIEKREGGVSANSPDFGHPRNACSDPPTPTRDVEPAVYFHKPGICRWEKLDGEPVAWLRPGKRSLWRGQSGGVIKHRFSQVLINTNAEIAVYVPESIREFMVLPVEVGKRDRTFGDPERAALDVHFEPLNCANCGRHLYRLANINALRGGREYALINLGSNKSDQNAFTFHLLE